MSFYFIREENKLTEVGGDDLIKVMEARQPPPSLGPDISDEFPLKVPEEVQAMLREKEALGRLNISTNALSNAADDDDDPATVEHDGSAGCGGSSTSVSVLALIISLFCMRRGFRLQGTLILLVLVVTQTGIASARTVYGRVVFWDSRSNPAPSAPLGARVPACNTGLTNCTPDDAGCCFPGIDSATISVNQQGVDLASFQLFPNGWYVLDFNGDDNQYYNFKLQYERAGAPGALTLTLSIPPYETPAVAVWGKIWLPSNTALYLMPDLRVNNATDTTSLQGGFASAWQSIAQAQRAVTNEGDTRHRRLFLAPSTDPDDPIVVAYALNSAFGTDCTNSKINIPNSLARVFNPMILFGTIYRGRVVGCDSTVYDSGLVTGTNPAFPPTRQAAVYGVRGTESAGLARGLDYLVGLLAWYNPATTPELSMNVFADCGPTGLHDNSNDCAGLVNNGRGLWEWIDSLSAQNQGVDNTDLTLKQIMDGLLYLKNTIGTSNGQGQEASFITRTTVCSANEDCAFGEACALQQSNFTFKCAGGDPHGSNIHDLATALNGMGSINVTQRGNLLGSLESSKCVGPADSTYPFQGGYRND